MHIVTLLLTRLPYISVYFIVKCILVNKIAADLSASCCSCGFSRRNPRPVSAAPPALRKAQLGSQGQVGHAAVAGQRRARPLSHQVAVTDDPGTGAESGWLSGLGGLWGGAAVVPHQAFSPPPPSTCLLSCLKGR